MSVCIHNNFVDMRIRTSNVKYGIPFGAHNVMVPSTDAENITLPSLLQTDTYTNKLYGNVPLTTALTCNTCYGCVVYITKLMKSESKKV